MKCAVVATLPPAMLKSLQNKKIEDKIKKILGKIQAGKEKNRYSDERG